MWMRKIDQQLAREHSRMRRSLRGPAIMFLVCFLADIVLSIQGPRHGAGEVPWPDTPFKILRDATFIASVVAVAGYVLQLVFGWKLGSLVNPVKVVICDTCRRVKNRDGEDKCGCGGTFDEFDKWTWIDDY
jgi:hypothetical protein